MYPVSNDFKNAIRTSSLTYTVSGSVGNVAFTADNILAGSFSITNQCADDSELNIGSVYVGELKATFLNLNIPRYSWQGIDIIPYFSVEGAADSIPIGKYVITEANWTASGVEVTAYDYMAKFDKGRARWPESDTLLNYVKLACNACHVTLGMTDAQFQALPNGTGDFNLSETNDMETYRDLLSWVAQTTATFATINRSGELVFRAFTQTVADTLNDYARFTGAKFSDYSTRYTGLSVVDEAGKKTMYYHVDPDNALVMNLGTNPFLQFGDNNEKAVYREAILTAVVAGIDYVPMEVSMIGSPAYDLGDVLVFTGGIADSAKKCCITKYDWTFGGAYRISGGGKNPALASAKSKTDKNLEGLMSEQEYLESLQQTTEKNYFDYASSTPVTIASGNSREVATITYDAIAYTRCEFRAEIQLDVDTDESYGVDASGKITYSDYDGLIRAYFIDNGDVRTDTNPRFVVYDGYNTIHLIYFWTAPANATAQRIFRAYLVATNADLTISNIQAYVSTFGGVEIEPNPATYIFIETEPAQWDVYVGDALDYSLVQIGVEYEDGTQIDVTNDCVFTPAEGTIADEVGDITVVVTYSCDDGKFELDFTVPVQEPYVTGIAVTTPPNMTNYKDGTSLNLTGTVVTATLNTGATKIVTADCVFDPPSGSVVEFTQNGITPVTVEYEDPVSYDTFTATMNLTNWTNAGLYINYPTKDVTYTPFAEMITGGAQFNTYKLSQVDGDDYYGLGCSASDKSVYSGVLELPYWVRGIGCTPEVNHHWMIDNFSGAPLSRVILPESCKWIGGGTFRNCSHLAEINLNYVELIGYKAFENCTDLNPSGNGVLTIPASVTSIDQYAFLGCTHITEVVFADPNNWSEDVSDPVANALHMIGNTDPWDDIYKSDPVDLGT